MGVACRVVTVKKKNKRKNKKWVEHTRLPPHAGDHQPEASRVGKIALIETAADPGGRMLYVF